MQSKKNSALPVRLTDEEKAQMAKIAEETGLTASTLIRLLIESLVRHYRENGGRLVLPIRCEDIFTKNGGGGHKSQL